jgi:hypothetical protein
MTPRLARPLCLVATSLLLLGACGDDDGTDPETSTTTTVAPTSTTEESGIDEDVEAAVLEGYDAAWEATIDAFTANPVTVDSPDVLATVSGPALAGLQDTLSGMSERGQHVASLAIERDPAVESVEGDTAIVVDCVYERSTTVSNADGSVVEQEDTYYSVEATMSRDDSTWVRDGFMSEEVESCEG